MKGSQMQTTRKSNSTITHAVVEGKIEFTIIGAGKVVFDPAKVSATNRARFMTHGMIQRISDGGAIERADKDGNIRSAAEMARMRLERMTAIAEHYMSGSDEWNIRTAVPKGVDAGLVVRAIIRAGLAADVDAANGLIDRMAAKREIERAASLRIWADSDKVARAIAEIRAEAATTDADALVAELGEE